jgi:uncharacterized membrane protein SpoIIM required for sporulation
MVLEQLYSAKWIEQKARYAFLMGLSYGILGIGTAILLFRDNPGLAAIAFTSLLVLPSLNNLLAIEEKQIAREKRFNILLLFRDHWDIIKVYIFLFLGMMLSFAFFSLVWPQLTTSQVFAQQFSFYGTATGQAAYSSSSFTAYLANNMIVLVIFLLLSFIYGAGSVLFLTWNASVWGTVFALLAKSGALASGRNPFIYFISIIVAVFLHMLLESGAYFLAIISGGIASKGVIKEKPFSENFNKIIQDSLIMFVIAIIVLVIAAYIESYISPSLINWLL